MKPKHLKFVRKYLYKYQGIWLIDVHIPFYNAPKAIFICTELNNRILARILLKN